MDWYIADAIRIVRILSDEETRRIIDRYNAENNANVEYVYPR